MASSYVFGEFTIDLDRCILLCAGIEVPLRPKAFDLLVCLVQNSGKLMTREQLIKAGWPSVVVTDDSLTQCLAEVRKALGDDRHEVVRTVPRRGYLFDKEVVLATPETAAPMPVDTDLRHRRGPSVRWASVLALALVLVVALGLSWWWFNSGHQSKDRPTGSPRPASEYAIAVLPFADLSPAGDHEYLADGVAEEILNLLAQIDGLSVAARTSSFSFKGKNPDLSDIADKLKVTHILEGSVRVAGERIRISAQLIDAANGMHLWSDTYDGELSVDTLFDVQSKTARAIANALSKRIESRDYQHRTPTRPANLQALNEYLEGQRLLRGIETSWNVVDDTFESAIAHFTSAIEADPAWAPAHVALGRTYHFWASYDHPERLDLAKVHVLEGLALDDSYAPAYESLGYILFHQRDFEGATRAYQRLKELGSDMSWGYATLLSALARFDESIAEYRNALLRDPLSWVLREQLAGIILCEGKDYTQAADMFTELVQNEPDNVSAHLGWIEAKLRLGERESALARLQQLQQGPLAENLAPDDVAAMLALAGRRQQATVMFEELAKDPAIHPTAVAWIAILLGDTDRALTILERAAKERPEMLLQMRCEPEFRALAGDSRYERVLDLVGFPR